MNTQRDELLAWIAQAAKGAKAALSALPVSAQPVWFRRHIEHETLHEGEK